MLKEEVQKQIASLLKMEEKTFLEALKSDKEVDITIPDGLQVFTAQELTARDTNQKKLGYDDGKGAGLEMLIKEQKQKHNLDFEGKDPEKFLAALQTKILADAKIEPDEKLKEKDSIITKLQGSVKYYEDKSKASDQKLKELTTRGKLTAVVPSGLPFDADEVIMSMQARGYSFDEDEKGAIIPKKNGEVIRDSKTQDPLDHKTVINDYVVNERKWTSAEDDDGKQGRGGKSDRRTAGVISSLSAAKQQWEAEGKSTNSADFTAHVRQLAKDNKDFDMEDDK